MRASSYAVAVTAVVLLLGGCSDDDVERGLGPQQDPVQEQVTGLDMETPPPAPNARLAKACERAFALIERSEPGTVPRKKAVEIANEAFFADGSPETNEAFSNLNNVYVFDDGTSSQAEVEAQLNEVCP